MNIPLSQAEERAFLLLRNYPDEYHKASGGQTQITVGQLHQYFYTLARGLEVAAAKRELATEEKGS